MSGINTVNLLPRLENVANFGQVSVVCVFNSSIDVSRKKNSMGVRTGDLLGHSIGFLFPMLSVEEGWDLVCNSDVECLPAGLELAIIIAYEDQTMPITDSANPSCTRQLYQPKN